MTTTGYQLNVGLTVKKKKKDFDEVSYVNRNVLISK